MTNFEREPQFNPEGEKDRQLNRAVEIFVANSGELNETQKATAALALAKFEGGNYSITQETVDQIY